MCTYIVSCVFVPNKYAYICTYMQQGYMYFFPVCVPHKNRRKHRNQVRNEPVGIKPIQPSLGCYAFNKGKCNVFWVAQWRDIACSTQKNVVNLPEGRIRVGQKHLYLWLLIKRGRVVWICGLPVTCGLYSIWKRIIYQGSWFSVLHSSSYIRFTYCVVTSPAYKVILPLLAT